MKDAALTQFRHNELVWAILAPNQKKPSKPPRVPSILKKG